MKRASNRIIERRYYEEKQIHQREIPIEKSQERKRKKKNLKIQFKRSDKIIKP